MRSIEKIIKYSFWGGLALAVCSVLFSLPPSYKPTLPKTKPKCVLVDEYATREFRREGEGTSITFKSPQFTSLILDRDGDGILDNQDLENSYLCDHRDFPLPDHCFPNPYGILTAQELYSAASERFASFCDMNGGEIK